MQHIVIDPSGALASAAHAFLVPDTREAIEAAVETLIARLDAEDGDPDLEPDDEGDPLDIGEHDEAPFLAPPIYGIDQTKGPLNEAAAVREYQRHRMGL